MINRFNADDNADGDYISVVIGSRVLNEGFTLKNVRNIFILTGHWNYSETVQAIARGWRLGSHNALLNRGDLNTRVDVYQCVSIPLKTMNVPSIDLEMYETAELKDVKSRQIERLVKETAFDCPLTVERNKVLGYDGQRECDYQSCDYKCSGTIGRVEDKSTYNLIDSIQQSVAAKINAYLRIKFKTEQFVTLDSLRRNFFELSSFEIAAAITRLVETDELYPDKYGFPNFLHVQGEILFVSLEPKTLSNLRDQLTSYYSTNSIIVNSESFDSILNEMYNASLPDIIQSMFDHPSKALTIVTTLPKNVQREILQGCLLARDAGKRLNATVRDAILDFYTGFYEQISINNLPKTWVVSVYADEIGMTCFDKVLNRFKLCDISAQTLNKKAILKDSPIGYYGLYNPKLNDFCLRDVGYSGAAKVDLRKLTVGRRCINFDSETLIDIIARRMIIDPPSDWLKDQTVEEITKKYKKSRFTRSEDGKNVKTMKRVLYWASKTKDETCLAMKTWFENNNLLEQNFDCGTQKKSRAKFM